MSYVFETLNSAVARGSATLNESQEPLPILPRKKPHGLLREHGVVAHLSVVERRPQVPPIDGLAASGAQMEVTQDVGFVAAVRGEDRGGKRRRHVRPLAAASGVATRERPSSVAKK